MNERHKAFIRHYLGDCRGNGTQAAIAAGYSERSAHVQASVLLKHPKIQEAIQKRTAKYDLTTDARLQKLGALADATPSKVNAADVIAANALILRVNGALKDKQQDSRITVNIGFLTPNEPTINVIHTDSPADSQVMPPRVQIGLTGDVGCREPGDDREP